MFERAPKFSYVLDTNVMLTLASCHDLDADLAKSTHTPLDSSILQTPQVAFRLSRARNALLLAIHLHQHRMYTYGTHSELLTKLTDYVPTYKDGTGLVEVSTVFTTMFTWFVCPYVLAGWQHHVDKRGTHDVGNRVDRWLVDAAARRRIPLLSAEGLRVDGTLNEKGCIRRHAKRREVTVVLPEEVTRNLQIAGAVDDFFHRFDEQAPTYLERSRRRFGDNRNAEHLELMRGYYRLVLRGEHALK